ncbi:MAG: gamma-glutamyltransferase [Alphaproteobacteria bacterium]|nr:gamma-glutamyltransferase [Alphaproteobacteria bacterium]
MRDFQRPGRSTAHAGEAMAATSHPLATLTAIETLRAGGNAIDAAVAAVSLLCVIEPGMTGLGGDCFVLYAKGGKDKVIAFNGSGRAPQAASADALRAKGVNHIEEHGVHSVTVPGCVQAWERLVADHGTKPLGDLLQPAIKAAEQGFIVTPRVAFDWANQVGKLAKDANAKATFLIEGRAPKTGERFKNPRLAATLKRVAKEGAKGFYAGPVAEDIVTYLRSLGGLHTMDDFARTEGEYIAPITTDYRGYTVHECPPNGSGITTLLMLNILEGYELSALDPAGAERLHLEVEASRLAFADRDAYVGDPRHVDVPVERLLSKKHAADQRKHIRADRAMNGMKPVPLPEHNDTTYLCVVDRDRNAVSFINSVFDGFGSGKASPNSGVVLQNRGSSFKVDDTHPNGIAGGKRPMHTIIPAMVTRGGRAVMPFGVMGGHFQPVGQSHVLTNIVDFGMDPQAAIDFPRAHHREGGVKLEKGYAAEVAEGLRKLGHNTDPAPVPYGGGQAIWIDEKTGDLVGGSEPRKDGMALGY